MKFVIIILFFQIVFLPNAFALVKCKLTEIHVKEHYVSSYITKKGKRVSNYFMDESCRKSKLGSRDIKFENKAPDGWNTNEIFKEWTEGEINQFFTDGEKLPLLLRNQIFEKISRAGKSIYPNNPAATLPYNKLIILYDDYFQRKDRVRVFGHEMAHLLYWQLNTKQKLDFAQLSGWNFEEESGKRVPPKRLIYPDSAESPSEDFANNIEAYYFDKNNLRKNNFKLFNFVKNLEKEMK